MGISLRLDAVEFNLRIFNILSCLMTSSNRAVVGSNSKRSSAGVESPLAPKVIRVNLKSELHILTGGGKQQQQDSNGVSERKTTSWNSWREKMATSLIQASQKKSSNSMFNATARIKSRMYATVTPKGKKSKSTRAVYRPKHTQIERARAAARRQFAESSAEPAAAYAREKFKKCKDEGPSQDQLL